MSRPSSGYKEPLDNFTVFKNEHALVGEGNNYMSIRLCDKLGSNQVGEFVRRCALLDGIFRTRTKLSSIYKS
jgi:hypothetical protein